MIANDINAIRPFAELEQWLSGLCTQSIHQQIILQNVGF